MSLNIIFQFLCCLLRNKFYLSVDVTNRYRKNNNYAIKCQRNWNKVYSLIIVFCFIFPTLNKFLWMFYKNPASLEQIPIK